MGGADLQARQQAAVYAALGHDADWVQGAKAPVPVRVIVRDEDRVVGMTVADAVQLRVRQSELANPAKRDTVELADGRRFEVIARPLLDRKRNWVCEAQPIAAAG